MRVDYEYSLISTRKKTRKGKIKEIRAMTRDDVKEAPKIRERTVLELFAFHR